MNIKHSWSDDDFAAGPTPEPDRNPNEQTIEEPAGTAARQQRNHPWYLDIWLYPVCRSTLVMGTVLVVVPLILSLIAYLSYAMLIALTFLLPFAVGIMLLCMLGLLVIDLYLIWYVCECVRDSAEGNLRAPDTLGRSPDHMELAGQSLTLAIGGLLYWLPAMLCISYVGSPWIRSLVLALTAATFPLAMLRVIMNESLSGFNPLPLPGMIWRTRKCYPAVVLATCVLFILPAWALHTWTDPMIQAWWWAFLLSPLVLPVLYYPLLVLAHIWGRYYDRYAEWFDV